MYFEFEFLKQLKQVYSNVKNHTRLLGLQSQERDGFSWVHLVEPKQTHTFKKSKHG